jgi:hypothetical protein
MFFLIFRLLFEQMEKGDGYIKETAKLFAHIMNLFMQFVSFNLICQIFHHDVEIKGYLSQSI